MLLSREHDVTSEPSARSALARIERGERYDVILCDLMMPEMTGMALHERLTQLAPEQAAAMLFLTGGAFTPLARAFVERFPDVTIEKPFSGAELLARVRRRIG